MNATSLTLNDLANGIKSAHAGAMRNASAALDYARQAGELLMQAKQSLPHGAFGAWVQQNCDVSLRQAQRYMGAAQGKQLPVRKIEKLVAPNTTPVSLLGLPVFKLRPSEAVFMESDYGSWLDELHIYPAPGGLFHYVFMSGAKGDGGSAKFSSRPVRQAVIELVINLEMRDWEFANIKRIKCEPIERNVMETEVAA